MKKKRRAIKITTDRDGVFVKEPDVFLKTEDPFTIVMKSKKYKLSARPRYTRAYLMFRDKPYTAYLTPTL